jgi:hypothetical protein
MAGRLFFALTLIPLSGLQRIATNAKAIMMTREARNEKVFCILLACGLPLCSDTMDRWRRQGIVDYAL